MKGTILYISCRFFIVILISNFYEKGTLELMENWIEDELQEKQRECKVIAQTNKIVKFGNNFSPSILKKRTDIERA